MFFFGGGGGGQSLMMKDLHRFIKHFVIKLHGIIWIQMEGDWAYFNSLKNPSLSDQFHVSNCLFSRGKRTSFTQIFLGRAPRLPSSTTSTVFWHYVEKKRRNKEVQTNSRIKSTCLSPHKWPFAFFFRACWNFRSEVRNPPPPEKILDPRLIDTWLE